jgi:FKBP-type peptidyl-prolyl cis-trans isomerase
VTLGRGTVINGWEEGLPGSKAGERRRLVIGSDRAYSPQGTTGIPPNAPLAFEVDVLDVR